MIYCVEDDTSIRELVVYTLQASGFEDYMSKLDEYIRMLQFKIHCFDSKF